jgi:hypothetical protein
MARPVLFSETTSEMYYGQMLNPLFLNLNDYNVHDFSQQGDATAHIANNSFAALCNFFFFWVRNN